MTAADRMRNWIARTDGEFTPEALAVGARTTAKTAANFLHRWRRVHARKVRDGSSKQPALWKRMGPKITEESAI